MSSNKMLPQKHKAITIYTNPYIQKQKKPNIDKINIISYIFN